MYQYLQFMSDTKCYFEWKSLTNFPLKLMTFMNKVYAAEQGNLP